MTQRRREHMLENNWRGNHNRGMRRVSVKRSIRPLGFTLIEVLVVVAIIGLLVAILVPSLSQARNEARAVQCATNLAHLGKAITIYATREQSYPVSYAYLDARGRADISPAAQDAVQSHPYGYVHWSYFLYSNGAVDDKAFQCPNFDNGGAPRTNPGDKQVDWEPGQVDDRNQSSANEHKDLQAARMAYTANASIMPRNKFTKSMSGGGRVNRLVRDSEIRQSSATIMATEFHNDWKTTAVDNGSGLLSKSHRPINPFYHLSTGSDEYQAPNNASRSLFVYGIPGKPDFGLLPYKELAGKSGLIESPIGEINSVGRHHPGGDKDFGGTANFLYVDTHVERKTVLETLKRKEWGDRYYGLDGNNKIEQ